MLWDGMILLIAVVLAINGWNRGLIGSWRGPVAMAAATLIVQPFYIDFSTWIMSRLRISPDSAVVAGYLMLWFSAEAIIEITLGLLIRGGVQHRPIFFNRLAGIFYGFLKAAVIVVLPLMASSASLKIPSPPSDRSGLKLPAFMVSADSYLIPGFESIAAAMVPICGNYVISEKAPSFTPTYDSAGGAGGGQPGEKPKAVPAETTKSIDDLLK